MELQQQNNKVILITGTSSGLGEWLVEYYLKLGYWVAGCARRRAAIKHDNYEHWQLDIADESAVVRMIKDIMSSWERIDILINNAGIARMNHFCLTSIDTFRQIMNTNVLGTFLISREVAKAMIKLRNGRIVNISSIAVPLALEGESIYVASKAAIEAMSRVMAKELANYNITVNAIGAAPMETALFNTVPAEKKDALLKKLPIDRMGKFEDIANAIDFFVKDESKTVTGQVIYMGGIG